MTRFLVFVLLAAITALGTETSSFPVSSDTPVTFNKDVLPILQTNCQSCHRPGAVAPMSFLTYESTRPWAKAMKAAVLSKRMPPWFADPHYGGWRNEPKLTQADINTISTWVDSGAREGDQRDMPPALQWTEGWRIDPDVIVRMPERYKVAAKGEGEIKQFTVPNPFKEDTWVSSIEIRPGDPSVVHHVIVQIPEQDPVAMTLAAVKGAVPAVFKKVVSNVDGVPVNRQDGGGAYGQDRRLELLTGRGSFTTMEAVYAPGSQPLDFRFMNSAKLIRGGSEIRIEVHYTPNGKETWDQTMVGFTLANAPAQRRFVIMAPEHLIDQRKPIPAGEANWETSGELTFNQAADLVWFMPHMHLRGKDMTFRLIYPNGREETVLRARFNFHWQLSYEVDEPIRVPKGTRMVVTAHHDNSANNPLNPTPDKMVGWGEMTGEEMMLPWFGVVVDRDVRPDMIASYKPGDFDGPAPKSPLVGGTPRLGIPQPAIFRPIR